MNMGVLKVGSVGSILAMLWILGWTLTAADDSPQALKAMERGSIAAAPAGEASVSPGMTLAQQYLSELLPVLAHLRDHEPEQYEKALRDLDRAAKRLEILQRRDTELYDVSLREWQTRGRIDLLKARLRVRQSDTDARQLLVQMRLLRTAEIQRMSRERELLSERETMMSQRAVQAQQAVEKTRRQIDELERQIEQLVAQPLEANSPAYLRALGLQRGTDRPAGSAAPNRSTTPPIPTKNSPIPTKKTRAPQ